MPAKFPNEATRRRTITEREVRDLITERIVSCKNEKAGAPRHSPHWHRMDAALRELTALKKDIRAEISRGRGGKT